MSNANNNPRENGAQSVGSQPEGTRKLPAEDKALVARLRDPSTARAAFGEVIKLYTEPLYWQIRRMVQNHDDANDLLQNTFMKAWTSIENFRGDARLSTWLYKIAINESLSHLEREGRRRTASVDDDEAGAAVHAIESDSLTAIVCVRNCARLLPHCLKNNAWYSTCATMTKCPTKRCRPFSALRWGHSRHRITWL